MRGTDFDRALQRAAHENRREFVFGWNRGLGDIALGLVPLFARIRARCPGSRIAVYTRAELMQAFALTDADAVFAVPDAVRGKPIDPAAAAAAAGNALPAHATVFADPDPTRWLDGQRQDYPPVLHWNPAWDALADRFLPAATERLVIGAHVHSETAQHYGYVKDWPEASWRALLARYPQSSGVQWVLVRACGRFGVAAIERARSARQDRLPRTPRGDPRALPRAGRTRQRHPDGRVLPRRALCRSTSCRCGPIRARAC